MKAIIFTFSGTGNTFLTAEKISASLSKRGALTESFKIENINEIPQISDADHILIGYPIHAFNAPENVVNFTRKLPASNGRFFSIFKVSGEPFSINNASSRLIIRILIAKGYRYLAETHILMPYNIVFRYPDSLARQMYLFMEKKAKEFAACIVEGKISHIEYSFFDKFISLLFRIQWGGARLNGRFYSCNKRKCTQCLDCVKNCPAGNISFVSGRIKFGSRCLMCMRCVQICRFDAINIGLLRFWSVRKKYEYDKLLMDKTIPSEYVSMNTKGYFKLFRSYFKGWLEYI